MSIRQVGFLGAARAGVLCWAVAAMLLGACHRKRSSSEDEPGPGNDETQHVVGGFVSGLEGRGLVLRLNGAHDLPISENGQFRFAAPLADGATYAVTIQSQPANPTQTCVVENGDGRVPGRDIRDVAISCTTPPAPTYTVGGVLTGLEGSGLVLRLNGLQDLPLSVSGPFRFTEPLDDGGSYEVTIQRQPSNPSQACAVAKGTGQISGKDVGTVEVSCITPTTPTFKVGGTLAGLEGSGFVLRLNDAGDLALSADGAFTFAEALADGSAYDVTIFAQPTSPEQRCTVRKGRGTLHGAHVTDVEVSCVTRLESTYVISGTLSGLETSVGLVLQNNGGDDLPLGADGSFAFSSPMADGADYRVTVLSQPSGPALECSVTGGSGMIMGADVDDVEVVCRGWRGAGLVENLTGNTSLPQIAFGPDGDAIAVWTHRISGSAQVLASRYHAGSWSTTFRLDSQGFNASTPQLAIDPFGNSLVVWCQENASSVAHVWASRYTKADGNWGTAEQLETGPGATASPQVAMDAGGRAFVTWSQRVDATFGVPYDVWAKEYEPGHGWHPHQLIESKAGTAVYPKLGVDGAGNVIAVWHQHNGTVYDIWTARRSAGDGWGTPALLEDDDTGHALYPELSVNANGDAMVVWQQADGTRTRVFAARYDSIAGSWGSRVALESSTEAATFPDVTLAPNGHALAVWRQTGAASQASVWAASYDPAANAWASAEAIASGGLDSASKYLEISSDAAGNAIVIYQQYTGGSTYHVFANRYVFGEGWRAQEPVETGAPPALYPQVAFDTQGRSLAIWTQDDGSGYSSVYFSAYR